MGTFRVFCSKTHSKLKPFMSTNCFCRTPPENSISENLNKFHLHYSPPSKLPSNILIRSKIDVHKLKVELKVCKLDNFEKNDVLSISRSFNQFLHFISCVDSCLPCTNTESLKSLKCSLQNQELEQIFEIIENRLNQHGLIDCCYISWFLRLDVLFLSNQTFNQDNQNNFGCLACNENHMLNMTCSASAFCIESFSMQELDELSINTGDPLCVLSTIESEISSWVFVKAGKKCGFVPSHCLKLITNGNYSSMHNNKHNSSKPIDVLSKHRKIFKRAVSYSTFGSSKNQQNCDVKDKNGLILQRYCVPPIIDSMCKYVEKNAFSIDGPYRRSLSHCNIDSYEGYISQLDKIDQFLDIIKNDSSNSAIYIFCHLIKKHFKLSPRKPINKLVYAYLSEEKELRVSLFERIRKIKELSSRLELSRLFYCLQHIQNLTKHLSLSAKRLKIEGLVYLWLPVMICEKLHPKSIEDVVIFKRVSSVLSNLALNGDTAEYFQKCLAKWRLKSKSPKPNIIYLRKSKVVDNKFSMNTNTGLSSTIKITSLSLKDSKNHNNYLKKQKCV